MLARKGQREIPVQLERLGLKDQKVIKALLAIPALLVRRETRESRDRRVFRAPRATLARLDLPARTAYRQLCRPAKAAM